MTTETIEGESREVMVLEPERLSIERTPEGTIDLASRMATALKDIVEKQKLFAMIQGKRYPTVEAWMTIARMDNVVAREVVGGILRLDDGSYEATVELVRLSDGMVVGRGSALCGTTGDRPWDGRPEPARRSMAVTRATSRAFRQQYSWIMALAGYEPTPAEEMPQDQRPLGTHDGPPDRPPLERVTHEPLIGTAEAGKEGSGADFELRETPDGHALAFRLVSGRKGWKVMAHDGLAQAIATVRPTIEGQRVRCYGRLTDEWFDKADKDDPKKQVRVTYQVLQLDRIVTDDFELPARDITAPWDPADLDVE